ncbi:MAG: hypothetical protein PHV33_10170 [Elusimicrobiales bacterium]|nr:hypothetical protein [Elusimicrobiales bacterium]
MKKIIAIVALLLAGNTLWAESGNKPLELKDVNLQAIKSVAFPEGKAYPMPVGSAARDNTGHDVLYAADGTVISIDYSIEHGSTGYEARPVAVSVANKAFTNRNRIRVVLVNCYDQGGYSGEEMDRSQIGLAYAGGTKYVGQDSKGLVLTLGLMGKNYTFKQIVTVEVDGKLLTNAQNNSRNFPLKMTYK